MQDENATADNDLGHADIQRLLELLPHRYPFLMIDKIRDMKGDKSAVGIKNVTFNEPFFQGHFQGRPVMPGVLIIEAMAQTAIALVASSGEIDTNDKLAFFMSIDNARFRRPVVPGDTLEIPIEIVKVRKPVWKFHGEAYVNGELAAQADYAAMAVDPDTQNKGR